MKKTRIAAALVAALAVPALAGCTGSDDSDGESSDAASTTAAAATTTAGGGFQCEEGETYVMNVMVSAHPYWVPVYQGFKQAAEAMGCETAFSGTPDYDITKQIASFEQDLVEKPAGVLLHPMQSDPFVEPINAAIDDDIRGRHVRRRLPELEAHLLRHVGQRRRGEVRRRGDRQGGR